MTNEDTKIYKVSWERGRKVGAIGIFYPDSVTVMAETPEEALRKAYETHEHLKWPTVTEQEEGIEL
tara:strand:- start:636 stop:833 length:198 start_codon:yes stop_codon:yes gene_type:complete